MAKSHSVTLKGHWSFTIHSFTTIIHFFAMILSFQVNKLHCSVVTRGIFACTSKSSWDALHTLYRHKQHALLVLTPGGPKPTKPYHLMDDTFSFLSLLSP